MEPSGENATLFTAESTVMVDWHSKMRAEPTAATFTSAAATFASAAAFEMPHNESLSQLSYSACVKMV